MLPFFAQGAGQAIEDAAALAACLSAEPADPVRALTRYERIRAPRATRVQEAGRGRIAHHHLAYGPEQRARDAAFAAEDPLSHNDWIYAYDAEQAVGTELTLLQPPDRMGQVRGSGRGSAPGQRPALGKEELSRHRARQRSEERRVGKEGRARRSRWRERKESGVQGE